MQDERGGKMTWILFAAIVVLFVLIDASIVLYRECREKPDDKVPREAFTRDDDYFDKVLNEPHGSD